MATARDTTTGVPQCPPAAATADASTRAEESPPNGPATQPPAPPGVAIVPPGTLPLTELEGVRQKVFMDRYALKDKSGRPVEQHPEQMWYRVAYGIAAVEATPEKREEWAQRFYDAMSGFKFVPGGRILSGAGTGFSVTYYNCYVLPSPGDSREGILENVKWMTEIMARGGGVGVNLSTLRPRGSYIKTVNGTASGPISWGGVYSYLTGEVIQQGGSRRGALMLMLDDGHPDIEEFITVKRDLSKINYANLSVCVSDRFMEAVKSDEPWPLVWQGEVKKTVRARDLWNLICESAWASGEPGLVFIDRYNRQSNTWYYEHIISVNPCGEQGLPAWGVCNLGALNLASFVQGETGHAEFDYDSLAEYARIAMRFLDNVVEANDYFIDENRRAQLGTRRTGLGTMGLADALIMMGVAYGSEESVPVIERIYSTIRDAAYEASSDIAAEKGPFPMFDRDKYLQGWFIQRLPARLQEKIASQGIRNAVLLTQAPTGTTSLLAGASSGIEPVFSFSFVRRDRIGEHVIYHPLYQAWKDAHPGVLKPDFLVAASDLTPEEHVRVQAIVQAHTDSSISKTVNAPNGHTVEEVQTLYRLAFDLGCKGVTYFRDGCRAGVLSHIEEPAAESPQPAAADAGGEQDAATDQTAERQQPRAETIQLGLPVGQGVSVAPQVKPRPRAMEGITYRMPTPQGTAFVTINSNGDNQPFEVFVQVGKAGSDTAAVSEALGRLVSLVLRLPSPLSALQRLQEVVDQLSGIGGGRQIGFGPDRVRSLPDGIAQVLAEYLGSVECSGGGADSAARAWAAATPGASLPQADVPGATASDGPPQRAGDLCPECGDATLVFEEACKKCYSCGYAEC